MFILQQEKYGKWESSAGGKVKRVWVSLHLMLKKKHLCSLHLVLHGLDLESEHCIFENVGGTVTLIPLSGSQCSVNGVQIMDATHLNQGI